MLDDKGICPNELSYKTYDPNSGRMTLVFDMALFNNNTDCKNAIDADSLGYDIAIDGDRFTIEIDATTLFSTLIVAYDINGNNSLSKFQYIDTIFSSVCVCV